MKTIYLIKDSDGQSLHDGDIVVKETKKPTGASNGHEYRIVQHTKSTLWKLYKKYEGNPS